MWGSQPHIFFFGGSSLVVCVERRELERQMAARLTGLGFELVDLRAGGTVRRPHLSVRIDWADAVPGRAVTVPRAVPTAPLTSTAEYCSW